MTGAALASPGQGGGSPVTQPVGPPLATVAPGVAEEMNGKDKPRMAGRVPMKPAKPVGRFQLIGKGRGNGCLVFYGDPGQCLPLLSPAQIEMPEMDHPWTCPEVRELFPDGIRVRGQDPLELDDNDDGVACGPGDG